MQEQIEALKKWLQEEHDKQNFMRDHDKSRGDLMSFIILGKMKEMGLIGEYTLLHGGRNQFGYYRYKVRYVGNEKIKITCDNCGWKDEPEDDNDNIPCGTCKDLSRWKPREDEIEITRTIERLAVGGD